MSLSVQTGYGSAEYSYSAKQKSEAEDFYAGLSSAAQLTKEKNESKVIGLTTIPYGDTNLSYGMRAQYAMTSTPDDPIIQVTSNYGGETVSYEVHVNEVDSENASQLEMFALFCYTDDQGISDGGTFGSYNAMKVYAMNAEQNGYCESLAGYDTFLYKEFDWVSIIQRMMTDYLEAGIYQQHQKCQKILETMSRYKGKSKDDGYKGDQTSVEENEDKDYMQVIRDRMQEILEKVKSGDTENSYQIGAESFTEEEWDTFLEGFDSVEEALRELMREVHKRRQEMEEEKERDEKAKEHDLFNIAALVADTTSCTYPSNDPEKEEIRYITWYTEEGIFCRKAGVKDGFEWTISFESKEQYDKVMEFIGQFSEEENLRFAAQENFWRDFLNDEIDLEGSQ